MTTRKVLWICNIMLPVIAEKLGMKSSNKEGWLSGLCDTILERRQENGIELHVAYPVDREQDGSHHVIETDRGALYAYGFYEDVANAERYEEALEERIQRILERVQPDVVHCFGTEFAHTLAAARCFAHRERLLVGIQGVCQAIADAYMADLPEEVQSSITFRDWLKKDGIRKQQQKMASRGRREAEILSLVGNVTGRTEFDRAYVHKCNPGARYYPMNETLRACFYEGQWSLDSCEPHTIFLSQADYPLKGFHYMLLAAAQLQEKYTDLKIKVAGNSLVNYDTIKDKIKISAYGRYLRRLLRENHLEDRVTFLGRLTAEEMKAQYLKSGLYVCCSSNENSPNSLGEAMLLGMPCVAARVGGIPSLFVDGQDGILYDGYETIKNSKNNMCCQNEKSADNGCTSKKELSEKYQKMPEMLTLYQNAANLAQAVSDIWENLEKTKCYSKNARLHARKTHNKEENYQKMTEIYAEICACAEKERI